MEDSLALRVRPGSAAPGGPGRKMLSRGHERAAPALALQGAAARRERRSGVRRGGRVRLKSSPLVREDPRHVENRRRDRGDVEKMAHELVCGRAQQNHGPQRRPGPSPWNLGLCHLTGQGDFAGVMKRRPLRWEMSPDHPRVPGVIIRVLQRWKREAGGSERETRPRTQRSGTSPPAAETGRVGSRGRQAPGEAGNGRETPSARAPRRNQPCQRPRDSPARPGLGFRPAAL